VSSPAFAIPIGLVVISIQDLENDEQVGAEVEAGIDLDHAIREIKDRTRPS
jgi:hypothetical protein